MRLRRTGLMPLSIALLLAALLASAGAQTSKRQQNNSALLIMGQRTTRSYFVNGKSILVQGNSHRIVWNGHSPLLRVTGDNNRIEADAVRIIIVSGRNNTVRWKRRYNGQAPRISRSGRGNMVTFAGGRKGKS